jgi:hypothetical protein
MTIINKIIEKIKKGEEISPFLFIGQNMDLLNSKVEETIFELFSEFKVPKVNLLKLENN